MSIYHGKNKVLGSTGKGGDSPIQSISLNDKKINPDASKNVNIEALSIKGGTVTGGVKLESHIYNTTVGGNIKDIDFDGENTLEIGIRDEFSSGNWETHLSMSDNGVVNLHGKQNVDITDGRGSQLHFGESVELLGGNTGIVIQSNESLRLYADAKKTASGGVLIENVDSGNSIRIDGDILIEQKQGGQYTLKLMSEENILLTTKKGHIRLIPGVPTAGDRTKPADNTNKDAVIKAGNIQGAPNLNGVKPTISNFKEIRSAAMETDILKFPIRTGEYEGEANYIENDSNYLTVNANYIRINSDVLKLPYYGNIQFEDNNFNDVIRDIVITDSNAITKKGEYAVDAIEKNASVEGTLANQIAQLNNNLISYFDYQFKLKDLDWTQSGAGKYFTILDIAFGGTIISVSVFDFDNFKMGDNIIPYIFENKIGLMSNTTDFYDNGSLFAQIKIRVVCLNKI